MSADQISAEWLTLPSPIPGITLRDWWAGLAISQMATVDTKPLHCVDDAYAQADALLQERDRRYNHDDKQPTLDFMIGQAMVITLRRMRPYATTFRETAILSYDLGFAMWSEGNEARHLAGIGWDGQGD